MKKIINNIGIVFLVLVLLAAAFFGVRYFISTRNRGEASMQYPMNLEEVSDPMERKLLETSRAFWEATEKADEAAMRAVADPDCTFVHIGMTCGLDQEIGFYTSGTFQPTEIVIHGQTVHPFGDTAIVITDCDYTLDIMGSSTTHHFAVTEVYVLRETEWKLIQFSFTALVN